MRLTHEVDCDCVMSVLLRESGEFTVKLTMRIPYAKGKTTKVTDYVADHPHLDQIRALMAEMMAEMAPEMGPRASEAFRVSLTTAQALGEV